MALSLALMSTVGAPLHAVPAAAAGVYFVSPAGSDSGPGTATQPWKTLTKAASSVAPGDVVRVAPGTYKERLRTSAKGTASSPITLLADGPGVVLAEGFVLNDTSAYLVLDGFEIGSAPMTYNYAQDTGWSGYRAPLGGRWDGTHYP